MKKTALNLQDKKSFAYDSGRSEKGRILVICGRIYEAWDYDTYIYDALRIAGYWDDKDRTYERIMHLRYWLRENVQHGHDIDTSVRSLKGAHLLCAKIINSEYRDPIWKREKEHQLQSNAKIFGPQFTFVTPTRLFADDHHNG